VGKSTLAEILSSMLYYEEGISLFVVDCDLTQDSFFKLREREKGTIGEDPALTAYMQTYFHQLERRSYRIMSSRWRWIISSRPWSLTSSRWLPA